MYKCNICGKTIKSSEFDTKDKAILHLERCHTPDLFSYLNICSVQNIVPDVLNHFYIEVDVDRERRNIVDSL